MDRVGCPQLKIAWTTSVRGPPITSQHLLYSREGMPSVPGAASRFEAETLFFTSDMLGQERNSDYLQATSLNQTKKNSVKTFHVTQTPALHVISYQTGG